MSDTTSETIVTGAASASAAAATPAGRQAFWRETLAAFAASGQNIRQFCRERKLREAAFYVWRRTLAERDGKTLPAAAAKKPVSVAKKPAPAFVPVKVKLAAPPAAGGEALRVELRGGRVLVLPASLPVAKLAEVLHALEGLGGEGRA